MQMKTAAKLTPLLLSPLRQQRSHLHESCRVNVSILAAEASLADFVAVRTATVGQRRPVKHRPMLLGVGAAEQRRALLLGAQVGEHVCAKAKIGSKLIVSNKTQQCFIP